jgi:predicted anti-sigma-YlaC factor YlaD
MKKLAAALLACTLAVTSVAHAGGPVIVEDTTVEAETPRSGWIVPVIVGAIILCAIACGNDDEPAPTVTAGG